MTQTPSAKLGAPAVFCSKGVQQGAPSVWLPHTKSSCSHTPSGACAKQVAQPPQSCCPADLAPSEPTQALTAWAVWSLWPVCAASSCRFGDCNGNQWASPQGAWPEGALLTYCGISVGGAENTRLRGCPGASRHVHYALQSR